MIRRRRPLLRAAVVGGGAYAVGRRSAQRSANQAQPEDAADAPARIPQQQGPSQEAVAPAAGPSLLEQLNQLDTLRQQGALTDREFTAAKAKLLGG